MTIGGNLKALRMERAMTQEQVAEQLGVTRQTLSSYESGRTRPDIDTLTRLCRIYDTDLDALVYGRSEELRSLRRIKCTAAAVAAVLIGMTLLSSVLLWAANRFFPVAPGQLTQEELAVFAQHVKLTQAWKVMDGILLALAFAGFALLLFFILNGKCRIPFKARLCYVLALPAGLVLAALPFALTDAVFTPVNYLITPSQIVARLLIFFAALQIAEWLRNRKRRSEDLAQ